MSEPKSLREILTERGLIADDGTPAPMRLITVRCSWCGCLQHQLVPKDAPRVACLECRRELAGRPTIPMLGVPVHERGPHPVRLACVDCNRTTLTPISDGWLWMASVRRWRCREHG